MRRASSRRRTRAVASATCVFFALSLPLPAFAADQAKRVRLAVVDVDGNSSGDSTDIHYFVEKGIRLSGARVELMALDDVLNAGAQATDAQNIAFGDEALAAGMRAFDSGDCGETLDQLGQAVTYYEQSMAFLAEFDQYVKALVHQAVCLARTGNNKAASQVLVRAYSVETDLDGSAFPKAEKLFQLAAREVQDRELSSVAVSSTPEGARVFVNGGYRGVAPAYRPGLRRGVHFVRVERQGYGRVGVRVDTSRGAADAKVDLSIKPARKKPLLDSLLAGLQTELSAEEAGPTTARLQGLLLVDYVVLYRASGPAAQKNVELSLYNLVSGRRLNRVSGTAAWSQRNKAAKDAVMELAKKLVDVELQTLVKVDTTPDPDPDPGPANGGGDTGDGGIVTKWWFWTAIGAVVLTGTTVGLVLGLQSDPAPPGLDKDGNGALILRF